MAAGFHPDISGTGFAAIGRARALGNVAPILDDAGPLPWANLERLGNRSFVGRQPPYDEALSGSAYGRLRPPPTATLVRERRQTSGEVTQGLCPRQRHFSHANGPGQPVGSLLTSEVGCFLGRI